MNRTPQYLGEKLKREVKIHYVPERIKNPLGYNCRVNEIVKKGNYDISVNLSAYSSASRYLFCLNSP